MKKLVLISVVMVLILGAFAPVVLADKPDNGNGNGPNSESKGPDDNGKGPERNDNDPNRQDDSDKSSKPNGKNDNGTGNEPDGDCDDNEGKCKRGNSEPEPENTPEPSEEPTSEPSNQVVSTCEVESTCDICLELQTIKAQNEQILANQEVIKGLLGEILSLLRSLVS